MFQLNKISKKKLIVPVLVSTAFYIGASDPVFAGLRAVAGFIVGLGLLLAGEAVQSRRRIETDADQSEERIPLGIMILCVLSGLLGLLWVVAGLFRFEAVVSGEGLWMGAKGVFFLGLGLVGLLVTYGLWMVTTWAWKLALAWYGLNGLIWIRFLIMETSSNIGAILTLVILVIPNGAALFYLYRKRSFYASVSTA